MYLHRKKCLSNILETATVSTLQFQTVSFPSSTLLCPRLFVIWNGFTIFYFGWNPRCMVRYSKCDFREREIISAFFHDARNIMTYILFIFKTPSWDDIIPKSPVQRWFNHWTITLVHDLNHGPQEKNCFSKSSTEFFIFLMWNKLKRLANIMHYDFI